MISANELLSVPHLAILGTLPDTIRGFWNDARTLTPGDGFLALRGQRDGHEFLTQALQAGAACAIVENPNPNIPLPQIQVGNVLEFAQKVVKKHRQKYRIISVTGSYGKTSTKEFLRRFFGPMAYATPENLNNILGITISLSQMDQERFGILEAGIDRPGEMAPIIKLLDPDCSIFTGIAPVHLSQFQDFPQLIAEKALILSYMLQRQRPCVIAAKCWPLLKKNLPAPDASLTLVGEVENFPSSCNYTRLTIEKKSPAIEIILSNNCFETKKFYLPAIPHGQIENFALAATVAKLHGISDEVLQERVQQWRPTALRGETFTFRGHPVYLDAYNANPAAMRDALDFFDQQYHGRKIYVLGGMRELGVLEKREHQALADYFKNHTGDTIIAVGPEMKAFCRALPSEIGVAYFESVEKVRPHLLKILDSSDNPVFIKGSHTYALWKLVQSA
ncbi:MAG: UDP-N-acetylmuramoyl-tripeptide--D-alanyl-D-alanine ligase [Verrucomicrobiota bacterium]|nr:MAG: UDP-N-acetylmuramoyl-tripeptide--D-alanyl-D-alanine ligase [Verrucomicrobiota bacterium]